MKRTFYVYSMLALVGIMCLYGCGLDSAKDKTKLKVVIAGSLLVPFQEIEREFEALNPDIDVLLEGHGSVQVIRSVTELNNLADLVFVADSQLIPAMMYSAPISEDGSFFADWLIEFSSNRLGLAYHENSAYGSEIDSENWFQIISKPEVTVGIADPRIDAMGYRTLMVLKLAEGLYGEDKVFHKVVGSSFEPAIGVNKENGIHVITVPELLKPINSRIKLRGYSILLMALLESGDLDYAFEYESVARPRGLKFLSLPTEIDLSSPIYEQEYRKVKVELDFKRFASLLPSFLGTRIVYGLTIPKNALHPEEAARFVEFILGQEGKRIFEDSWQPSFQVPICDKVEHLPASLGAFFTEK